jgi:hypothetical protein
MITKNIIKEGSRQIGMNTSLMFIGGVSIGALVILNRRVFPIDQTYFEAFIVTAAAIVALGIVHFISSIIPVAENRAMIFSTLLTSSIVLAATLTNVVNTS